MIKPIGASGAYQALLVATQLHLQFGDMTRSISSLTERLRARPLVARAIIELMRCHGLDEVRSYDRLRVGASASRQSIEELAVAIVATPALASRLSGDQPGLAAPIRSDRMNRRNS
jgi:AmiR/NasT family two-component response regulator